MKKYEAFQNWNSEEPFFMFISKLGYNVGYNSNGYYIHSSNNFVTNQEEETLRKLYASKLGLLIR